MRGGLAVGIGNADGERIGLDEIGDDFQRGGPFADDVDGISSDGVTTREGTGVHP